MRGKRPVSFSQYFKALSDALDKQDSSLARTLGERFGFRQGTMADLRRLLDSGRINSSQKHQLVGLWCSHVGYIPASTYPEWFKDFGRLLAKEIAKLSQDDE
jgi:hypothetical protein